MATLLHLHHARRNLDSRDEAVRLNLGYDDRPSVGKSLGTSAVLVMLACLIALWWGVSALVGWVG